MGLTFTGFDGKVAVVTGAVRMRSIGRAPSCWRAPAATFFVTHHDRPRVLSNSVSMLTPVRFRRPSTE